MSYIELMSQAFKWWATEVILVGSVARANLVVPLTPLVKTVLKYDIVVQQVSLSMPNLYKNVA